MNHETINRNHNGSANRAVRRIPDSDILDPNRTITVGQMAARMGVLEARVLKVIQQLGLEPTGTERGLPGYALRDFGVIRAHLRGKR